MKRLIPLIILFVTALSTRADEIQFTYDLDDAPASGYGFTSPEKYDVAIFIRQPALTGAHIKGITAYLPSSGGSVSEVCAGWTSTTLPDKDTDCRTLPGASAGTVTGNTIRITFAEPAVIPSEGIYVGYTIDVTEITTPSTRSYPVEYVSGTTPGALFLRTTSRDEWINSTERSDRMSTMRVDIDADLPENGASLSLNDVYQVKGGTTGSIPVTIANHGLLPITSVSYAYESGNTSGEGTVTLPAALPALFGKSTEVNLSVDAGDILGETPLRINITRVNGTENGDSEREASASMNVLPEIPVYRPLVEEYSGLWCMACPAGYVALEEGRDQFGDDFVALAYHYNDDMVTGVRFPSSVSSYPTVWVDRAEDIPANTTLEIWQEYRQNMTDIDIQCDIEWTDNTRTNLKATSKVTSMTRKSGDFRICYALVADGLSNQSWGQANNFSGALLAGKYWDLFTKGGGYVYGLTFNDIVCLLPDPFGVEGSLPRVLEQFEQYSHTYTFDVTQARMRGGVNPCANRDNLRVVAIILDGGRNRSLNCVSSAKSSEAPVSSGVDEISGKPETVLVKYYDFEGRELGSAPDGTPFIRIRILSDGTSRSEKIMPLR